MGTALTFLNWYDTNGDEFLNYIITGDKTWIFHNTRETFPLSNKAKESKQISGSFS